MFSWRKPSLNPNSFPSHILTSVWLNSLTFTSNSSVQSHVEINTQSLNFDLKSFTECGSFDNALDLYRILRSSGAKPDRFTLPYVLKACASLPAIDEGFSIHSHIIKSGFGHNPFIMNSLVEMYSHFHFSASAEKVFDEMPQRNSVSWNLMISCYRAIGDHNAALEFCSSMKHEGMTLDKVGLKIVLPICGHLGALRLGESIHAHSIRLGFPFDTAFVTSILDMYAKCGEIVAASQLFDGILCKDVVSWNAMITGYAQIGKPKLVLELFHGMLELGLKPTIPTILLILQACTHLLVLRVGKAIHGFIAKLGFSSDISIMGLLIDSYSKCGEITSAVLVFSEISKGNLNSWSCMIHGLGMHGHGREALMGFFNMLKSGIEPDGTCFLLILSSFSHCGMIDEGRKMFYYMVERYRIQPRTEHLASMVDILGRAGCIDEAFGFMSEMGTEPDHNVVGAFLGACRIHGQSEMGKVFGDRLFESGWSVAGFYKLLVSIYAAKGLWDEVIEIRRVMKQKRLGGLSGYSSIELSG